MCDQQSLRATCPNAQSDPRLCKSLDYSMNVKLPTEHNLEFLRLKGGCAGSSESTFVKMQNCWKSHVTAQFFCYRIVQDAARNRLFQDSNGDALDLAALNLQVWLLLLMYHFKKLQLYFPLKPICRPPDKNAYWKTIFIISQPKHLLWVLKRTVSLRRFF